MQNGDGCASAARWHASNEPTTQPLANGDGPIEALLVSHDDAARQLVGSWLEADGYRTRHAADGPVALDLCRARRADVALVDAALPSMTGFELLVRLRQVDPRLPIIVVSGEADDRDCFTAFEYGADDCMVIPFSVPELLARVRTVVRRASEPPGSHDRLCYGGLDIDVEAREVRCRGVTVALTAKEFDLLAFLASQPRRVFTREELLAKVWRSSTQWQDPDTVTEHVRRIRRKIEADQREPRWITTVRGVGYRFRP